MGQNGTNKELTGNKVAGTLRVLGLSVCTDGIGGPGAVAAAWPRGIGGPTCERGRRMQGKSGLDHFMPSSLAIA